MNKIGKILWGFAFIIVGTIIGTNALDLTDINIFFNGWWTLLVIIPNLIGLFSNEDSKFGNLIGLVIGIILLLATRGVLDFDTIWALFIPCIFILIGLLMVFDNVTKNNITSKVRARNADELESIVATFAEQKVNINEEDFKGANIDSIFGNVVLDLRKAKINKEAVIKTSIIFGGAEIIVPSDTNVKIKSTPIFGGVSNKVSNKIENKKTIYIESFCLFGGLEIR